MKQQLLCTLACLISVFNVHSRGPNHLHCRLLTVQRTNLEDFDIHHSGERHIYDVIYALDRGTCSGALQVWTTQQSSGFASEAPVRTEASSRRALQIALLSFTLRVEYLLPLQVGSHKESASTVCTYCPTLNLQS